MSSTSTTETGLTTDPERTRVHVEAANALIRSGFEQAARACELTVVPEAERANLVVRAEPGPTNHTTTQLIVDENGIHLEAPLDASSQTLLDAVRLGLALLRTA